MSGREHTNCGMLVRLRAQQIFTASTVGYCLPTLPQPTVEA